MVRMEVFGGKKNRNDTFKRITLCIYILGVLFTHVNIFSLVYFKLPF